MCVCVCVTCRLTAKNRDQLRNPTLGNRVRAAFTVLLQLCADGYRCIGYLAAVAGGVGGSLAFERLALLGTQLVPLVAHRLHVLLQRCQQPTNRAAVGTEFLSPYPYPYPYPWGSHTHGRPANQSINCGVSACTWTALIGVNSYWAQGLTPPTFMIMGLAYMTSPPTFVT